MCFMQQDHVLLMQGSGQSEGDINRTAPANSARNEVSDTLAWLHSLDESFNSALQETGTGPLLVPWPPLLTPWPPLQGEGRRDE